MSSAFTVAAELEDLARRLARVAASLARDEGMRPQRHRADADLVLTEARALAQRHGLKWALPSDREICIALAMGRPSSS